MRIQCTACISIGLLILLVSFGCDSDLLPDAAEDLFPGSRRSRENLKTLGKIYHAYHDNHRTGPNSWATTEAFCQQYEAWQEVLQELRSDEVVVHWGISFAQAKVGTSNYVLAYEKSTPKSGGWVLRLDGSVVKYDPQMLQDGLQNQAQVDQEVFGRSPPVPIEFSPELARGTGAESQGESVGKIESVSQRTKTPGPWEHVFAREGYALGAIQVDADKFVHAVRLAFMRIDGDRLDAKDSYVSEWIGSPSGAQPETLNGNGAPVMGFHGRAMAIVDAVGLVFAKD